MKRSIKLIAVILSLVMCLTLLISCGGGAAGGASPSPAAAGGGSASGGALGGEAAPPEGANLAEHIDIINNESQLTIVNPTSVAGTGGPATWAYDMIYDRLLQKSLPQDNTDQEYLPMLATEWHTDDYITFTFKLRDDVKFHNGDPFTAEDVIFTIENGKATPSSPTYSTWKRVKTATAPDPYTLEIVLDELYVDFYFLVSRPQCGILNQNSYNKDPNDPSWAQVGTGPYKVKDFVSNDYLTIERFNDYYGEKARTESVTFWTIPEMSTRLVKMENGEAQLSFLLNPEDLDVIEENPDFTISQVTLNEPYIIGFNNQGDKFMTDLNFRLAINHALNYEELTTVFNGKWARAAEDGNLWGLETQYRLNEGLPRREQDLDLAREYLAKTSYNGETIEMLATSPHNIRGAEIVQQQLKQIGINIDVQQTDHAGFVEALIFDPKSTRQTHFFALGMGTNLAAALAGHTSQTQNRLNYADPYFYDLVDQYYTTTDEEGRREIAEKMQRYWDDTIPAIPVCWRIQPIVSVQGIGGVKLYPDQFQHSLRGIYWDLNKTPEDLRP
jgi:peptide/nickel transport system substrate-binding protein